MLRRLLSILGFSSEKSAQLPKFEAERGDSASQFQLGKQYYESGKYKDAALWYEKAMALGNAMAQFNLGLMYVKGQGVPQNYDQARQCFEKAAAQGLADAQFNLGIMYYNGQGVRQDVGYR